MSISQELGKRREVELPQGTISYRERGSGEPIVFIHGLLVNGDLRKVVPVLSKDYRCIAPDLPLGSHAAPMSESADVSPHGLAKLIDDFLAALDLRGVTLVGTSAVAPLPDGRHTAPGADRAPGPDALRRLRQLPPDFFQVRWRGRGGRSGPGCCFTDAVPSGPRRPVRVRMACRRRASTQASPTPGWSPRAATRHSRDLTKVISGVQPRYLLEASERLGEFGRRAPRLDTQKDLLEWEHAEALSKAFPDARLERVDDSYTFVSEDRRSGSR